MSFIPLERGLRQGCPLSMPVYVIAAQTMAINIRCNAGIHGILTPDSQEEVKLLQFADGTTPLLVDENPLVKLSVLLIFMRKLLAHKLTRVSAMACGVVLLRIELTSLTAWNGLTSTFLRKSLSSTSGMWTLHSLTGIIR